MTILQTIIAPYIREAEQLAKRYESVSFEDVHGGLIALIPGTPGVVLDVGAGSGRDAAWFARRGHKVIAVEPAGSLRQLAGHLHHEPNIRWVDAALPELAEVAVLGMRYDIIWLSAVWMHLPPSQRDPAMHKMAALLKPRGRVFVSLRHGPKPPGRVIYKVTVEEVSTLARPCGLATVYRQRSTDRMNREGVWWEDVVLELPVIPGTGPRDSVRTGGSATQG